MQIGSPVLVVITQANHLGPSRFSAFVFSESCIICYIFPQASGRADIESKGREGTFKDLWLFRTWRQPSEMVLPTRVQESRSIEMRRCDRLQNFEHKFLYHFDLYMQRILLLLPPF